MPSLFTGVDDWRDDDEDDVVAVDPAAPPVPLRDYQDRLVAAIFAEWVRRTSTMIVAATGTGKTVIAAHTAKRHLESGGWRVLILVHRDELIRQTVKTLKKTMPGLTVEVEQGTTYARPASPRCNYGRVVVASVQTLWQERRLDRFPEAEFSLVIVDECHHAVTSNATYSFILKRFWLAKILGITATPDRQDRRALGQLFESVAGVYDIVDARNDGWLVPIIAQQLFVEGYDLSRVKVSNGKLNERQLAEVLTEEKPLQGIVDPVVDLSNRVNRWGSRRPTLVFAASVDHARLMADMVNRRHDKEGTGRAACIDCELTPTAERRRTIAAYRSGDVQFLFNFGTLTEGFDAPETRIVVIARPTKSRALFTQMVGRGTRPLEEIVALLNAATCPEERRRIIAESSKPGLLVVDPVGIGHHHKLALSTPDILGGWYDYQTLQRAKQNIAAKGGRGDVHEEVAKAKQEILARKLKAREDVVVKVKYRTAGYDPFGVPGN